MLVSHPRNFDFRALGELTRGYVQRDVGVYDLVCLLPPTKVVSPLITLLQEILKDKPILFTPRKSPVSIVILGVEIILAWRLVARGLYDVI